MTDLSCSPSADCPLGRKSHQDQVELAHMLGEIKADVKWLREQHKDLDAIDNRLRTQETKTSWLTGAGLVIAAIATKAGFSDIGPLFWSH